MNCIRLNRLKALIACACLAVLFPLVTSGQSNSNFKKLSKNEGLSQASVFTIAEDVDGFMWFGTRDGLNRYDGYKFKVIRSNADGTGIAGNDVRTLYSDPLNGDLWIGTLEGLSVYDRSENLYRNFKHEQGNPKSLSSSHVTTILRDSNNKLWLGTGTGLHLFDEEADEFIRFTNGDKRFPNVINTLYIDSDSIFWVGTQAGLFRFDRESQRFEKTDLIDLQDASITAFEEDVNGDLWIGTSDSGIIRWDRSTKEIKSYQHIVADRKSLSHNDVRVISLDKNDRLWIGTRVGLNLYNRERDHFTTYKRLDDQSSGISDNSVKSVYCDRKGSLWVGTYYGGVNHLDEAYSQFVTYEYSTHENGLKAPVVSCFAEDEKENLWIGTEGGGLSYYNSKNRRYQSFQEGDIWPSSISGDNVKQLLLDGNSLWVGFFSKGLDHFDLKTREFTNYNMDQGLSSANVYDISRSGDWLWLATYGGGLNLLNPLTNEVKVYRANSDDMASLSSDFIRVVFQTKENEIWIGSSNGLNKVVKDSLGFPTAFEKFLSDKKIYSIHENQQGQLWVGTISSGLYMLDLSNNEILHFTSENGLSGNTVYGILEDDENYLWISTNNGISRFNSKEGQFVNFNNANGLGNAEFNFNAYTELSSGEFLFGGLNGYTRFNPKDIEISNFIPEVVFTDITHNNQPLELDQNINEVERIIFKHNQANFTIDFAALDYSNPSNNYYAYKLEGLEKDWNFTIGDPSATYTIQRAGKYIFKFKGGNSAGLWNEDIRELEITVLPPLWFSWWAYLMYALLIAIAVYSVFRYLSLRTSLELEKKEKEQLDELSTLKLNFFTNVAHEFRTPLTLIIGPLEDLIKNFERTKPESLRSALLKINGNAQRMLNLVNQLMTFRRIEAGHEPLAVQEVKINDFLNKIFDLFKDHATLKNITYKIKSEEVLEPAWLDVDKIEKVLFNLLSNAFKFTPSSGEICVVLEEDDQNFLIKVRDSGAGIPIKNQEQIFQRFYEKNPDNSSNLIKGTGIGLSLSKQLVELHKGRLEVVSSEGKGAEFIVSIPKGKSHFAEESFSKTEIESQLTPFAMKASSLIPRKRSIISDSSLKILLVDDNKEIVDYLTSLFEGKYKIITASSGKEGLLKSKDFQPDLIISDVMMPEMNGFEFCRQIRSSFETSHIPVILLTAKSILADKIEGLESGANDFISKPFHPEELILKIENLLKQRENVKKALKEVEFEPSELDFTSADEQFLENLVNLVDKNIGNPDFKIEQFSSELAVSRALLFTKIKALTDMTPKNFLKSFRMKRAVSLLESGKLSVHEIAYTVGYKDPKYFSKVFHKEFGKNPSEYVTAFKL